MSSVPSWPLAPVTRILICCSPVLDPRPQGLPPPLVVDVPPDGLVERLLEGHLGRPAELGDLPRRDRIAAIVTQAVLHVLHGGLVLAERVEDRVGDLAVRALVARADVV